MLLGNQGTIGLLITRMIFHALSHTNSSKQGRIQKEQIEVELGRLNLRFLMIEIINNKARHNLINFKYFQMLF